MGYCIYSSCTECSNKMVDISGVCDIKESTKIIKDSPYWKQIFIPKILEMPESMPNIDNLISVSISINIVADSVIKMPIQNDTNKEGKLVTGRAIVIQAEAKEIVVYSSENVAAYNSEIFYVPCTVYIALPTEITFMNNLGITVTDDPLNIDFQINSCIEYINICLIDNRSIRTDVLSLFYVIPKK